MLKRMNYVRVLGVAKSGRAIATQQYGYRTAARDHSIVYFPLTEVFISKSTSCIARECHIKLVDHNNSSYKPDMKSPESGQTDNQTDTHRNTHTHTQTTVIYPSCASAKG